ncbi:hypothetical protein A9R05_43015 (plasmid) [Burkholderia sp. KK1]|uniref:Bacteriophage CI repressor n=1 Tax=Burkholderia sp. M701 TaxID=326454 RepID=V5YP32_9BURK|nr:helix-turn-helix domain-containing protein [Burkholderia sp. M701]AQH05792.1 hypothetical protein A9R05_43015 [Burkholderia sp. KK1]BAO19014.1 bacteriophage CI repressor [Burkholderia sp. M701]
MGIDAQSQRSTKILMNLAAGLDEAGKPFSDGCVRLTANLRLAASSGAAALDQLQGVHPLPGLASSSTDPSPVHSADQEITTRKGAAARSSDLVSLSGWLDRLKKAKGFHADIALADYLGVSKNQFSQWRNGRASPTTDESWRIAVELGANPLLVIASIGYQFSSLEKRQVWLDLAGTQIPARATEPLASLPTVEPPVEVPADPDQVSPSAATPIVGSPAPESRPGLESRGLKWTPEEDARLVEEYRSLMPIPDIALAHKRTIGAILYRLYRDPEIMSDDTMATLCERFHVTFTKREAAVSPPPTF